MATGKEIVRMMTCGYWEDEIKTMKEFCWAKILDEEGKPISLNKAENKKYCQAMILFKRLTNNETRIIACFLQNIASTNSENMTKDYFTYYGKFNLILIH